MIEIEEALRLIDERAKPITPVRLPLTKAAGRILAEPIVSDTDTPPFNKSMMDGYAVRSQEVDSADVTLPVSVTIAAGDETPAPLAVGTAARIMTGAAVPAGADAVVAREETAESEDSVIIRRYPVSSELNLMQRGQICRAGDTVLRAGDPLSAAAIGVLAEAGCDAATVIPTATVTVLATGNELVTAGAPLRPGQIRNSNGPMLVSIAQRLGCTVRNLGIGVDDRDSLRELVQRGLEANVLILSGGVSAGDFDLVPSVLGECGVTEVFHKVRLKPGKPIWFGTSPGGTLVFGLPGNPVSSLVCFRLFVAFALRRLSGVPMENEPSSTAVLKTAYRQSGDRTTYFPARVAQKANDRPSITILPWLGSSDLHTFIKANCLAVFPAGQSEFDPGSVVEYLPLDGGTFVE